MVMLVIAGVGLVVGFVLSVRHACAGAAFVMLAAVVAEVAHVVIAGGSEATVLPLIMGILLSICILLGQLARLRSSPV